MKVPRADSEEIDEFSVTRDIRLLQNTMQPSSTNSVGDCTQTGSKVMVGEADPCRGRHLFDEDITGADQENIDLSPDRGPAWNLHELSV